MYIFYDTETTGLDLDFIQILQIGLIATDAKLKDVASEKLDGHFSPWELPAPGALMTTGFDLGELSKSQSNFEMISKLSDWLKQMNAKAAAAGETITFIGYNSADYDEEVLSQNFYQNLLPANVTTGAAANGEKNGRADVIAMVRMATLYNPGALVLDAKTPSGLPSMTLKSIARQNGVNLGDDAAHDALNDIRATVGVAGVIQKVAPQVWEQSLKLSTLEGANKFLAENNVFTASEFQYGKVNKASVMTALAQADGSTTKQALFDLRVDPTPYLTMSVEELKHVILSQEKKEDPFFLVDKSNAPMLMPIDQSAAMLTEADDLDLYAKRAETLKSNPEFLANVAKAAQEALKIEGPHLSDKMPEAQMNKAVAPDVQAKLDAFAAEFREAGTWHGRAELTRGFYARFDKELAADPSLSRFEKLAARLVFEHAPEELSESRQTAMQKFIAYRFLDQNPKAPYMTIARARSELAKIKRDMAKPNSRWAEAKGSENLAALEQYYNDIEAKYAPLVAGYRIAGGTPPTNDNRQESSAPVAPKRTSGDKPQA